LRELGVEERPRLSVFNKIDKLTVDEAAALAKAPPNGAGSGGAGGAAFVSAVTGAGLDDLLARIDEALPVDRITKLDLRVPLSDGRTLAMIYAAGRVLNSKLTDEVLSLEAEVPESLARRLTSYIT
jgi:GTP-binding protein HflX